MRSRTDCVGRGLKPFSNEIQSAKSPPKRTVPSVSMRTTTAFGKRLTEMPVIVEKERAN